MLQDANVLITGGAGFIGSHVVDELLFHDVKSVTVVDDLSRGKLCNLRDAMKNQNVVFERCIIGNRPLDLKCDVLIHMAARVGNIQSNRANHLKSFYDNMFINDSVFRSIYENRITPKLLVYISTACVYPQDAPVPTPESAADVCNPEPENYGHALAKFFGEKQAQLLHQELGIPTLIVRFFNAIGTRDHYDDETSHVTAALIKRSLSLKEGEPLIIWGSGKQTRVFVDVRDIAAVLCKLIEQPKAHDGYPINIGHQNEVSIDELARMVLIACNSECKLSFDISKPDGHANRAACTKRLESLIGKHEFTILSVALNDMVLDYKQRYMENSNA